MREKEEAMAQGRRRQPWRRGGGGGHCAGEEEAAMARGRRRRRRGGGGGHGAGEEEAVQGGGGGQIWPWRCGSAGLGGTRRRRGSDLAGAQLPCSGHGQGRRGEEEAPRAGRHGSTGGRTNMDRRARRGRSECGAERLRPPDFLERPRSASEENIPRREPLRSTSLAAKHLQK
ncbi:LOW QUALITY PROTEIN: hypothetical protein PAHAL_4G098100 [Panicum hallii]|uniref:Uncharacterized protein n=1 Tax=Panicum hallii TaxID=206008 RepID=A0A2T8JCE2_9POAL|nr:LOW QUALITY PROTEIN: hypothetical protein PAHAL_4G098100 [Panicum hallii]